MRRILTMLLLLLAAGCIATAARVGAGVAAGLGSDGVATTGHH